VFDCQKSTGVSGEAGTVVSIGEDGVVVAAGEGGIRILKLRPADSGKISAHEFATNQNLLVDTKLSA
jgi:methionyl-tRNA formyltransferase